jgi:N-acetylglucosaminyl-diphospho-decaprenol L-rhamnosyltransferase
MNATETVPWVSVVVVSHNDGAWLPRCVESIRGQTVFDRLEVILVDDASDNGTDQVARELAARLPNAHFLATPDLGYAGACNRAAAIARGRYLYFINPDTWLEPNCVEELYRTGEEQRAGAVSSTVLQYDNDAPECVPAVGFDFCGNAVGGDGPPPDEVLFPAAFFFVRRDAFERVGGMDARYYLTSEEMDLSWRLWVAGERIVPARGARIHHKGAVVVNPDGGAYRTSVRKRYYANRNRLVSLAKNCQHVLLLMLVPCALTVLAEGLATWAVTRKWSLARASAFDAFAGFVRLWPHIRAERRRVAAFRKRSDWWMLRFFRLGFGRWPEVRRALRHGYPKFA